MKKIPVIIFVLLMCFTFSACDWSIDKDGGEMVMNLTQLPTPAVTEIRDDYVYWQEVPNASSYVIKINNFQESAGNSLKYSIAAVMDNRIDADTPIELHIYVKAKGNQILFSDSEWSSEITYTYTKISSNDENKVQVGFNDIYKSNGLGRTIDLINADSYKPKSGVGYIFNEEALFRRTLLEEAIRDQKAIYEYGTSYDSFYNKWKFDIGLKVANNTLGINGNFLPGTADFNIEAKGGYEQVRKEETKELYIKMHHNIVGKSVEILGHASDYDYFANNLSESFKTAAKKVVDDKTAEQFIDVWGTHVIMAAYYGAAFEASYYNISHDKYKEDNWYVDIEAAVKAHLFFSDLNVDLDFDLNRDTNDNSKKSLTNFEAHVVGGNGVALASDLGSFQKAYETWANGLTESNYTLIDFPENSLYCIWDFLDDSYYRQKSILNNYLYSHCQKNLNSIRSKISDLYNSESIEYLDDSHNVSYQASTKTLTFDFSQYQEAGNIANTAFSYERFDNGILTINPVEHGRQIEKIVFKGAYKTRSIDDNHLVDSVLNGLSIKFSENWTSGVSIEFDNFAFSSTSNNNALDLSSIPENEQVQVTFVGNNHLACSSATAYGIICNSDLKVIGDNDIDTYIRGSIYSDSNCEISFDKKLTVYGSDGVFGEITQDLIDGKSAIGCKKILSLKVGPGSHLYGGNGAKPGRPPQVSGRKVTGAVGYNGGDGGAAVQAYEIKLLSGDIHLHAGNGGEGGQGGTGSEGISMWDTGPDGGSGGQGGRGGNGGAPTKGTVSIVDSSLKIYIYGGNGGQGGNGGTGGDGGISDGEGILIIDNSRHKGIGGGIGGNGGAGGVSSVRLIQSQYTETYYIFVDADELRPGDGGNAGNGGAKGYIYNHSWDHGTYYGRAGSPGKSGTKGAY